MLIVSILLVKKSLLAEDFTKTKLCYRLTQELQYAIETLPVDVNVYLQFGEAIQTEINLIKGWRKSDNKFKGVISDSATNFCNVNNNGNANNNNASNSNGVRPDFDSAVK